MHYVLEWIVIRKKEIKSGEWILTIFTKEYGKIRWFTKIQTKNGGFDIGHLVEFHIKRKNDTNTISSLRTKTAINTLGCTYEILMSFMHIISCIDSQIPENGSDISIYDDLRFCIETQRNETLWVQVIRLMELRLLLIFQQEIHSSISIDWKEKALSILKKLEAIWRNHTLEELMRIQWIPKETFDLLHIEFLRNFFPWQ